MKIRDPRLIRAAAWLSAQVVHCWMRTVRCDVRSLGPDLDPRRADLQQRCIYAFWHENMLLPLSQFSRPDVHVLISKHADGQLIAEIARHMGLRTVRGSTSRGGAEALRQMLRVSQSSHLVVTPDGPRGPRRQVQPGIVYVAARTGLPIVPVGVGYRRPWRLGSWDRFAIPRPGSYMVCLIGEQIRVPAEADRAKLELYRQKLEQQLLDIGTLAEHCAALGFVDLPDHQSPAAA